MRKFLLNGRIRTLAAAVCTVSTLAVSGAAYTADAERAPVAAAVNASSPPRPGGRGDLVATPVHLHRLSKRQVAETLRQARYSSAAVRYGVDTYRLIYRTVDPHGRPTRASGLLVVPRTATRQPRLVSFTHGTQSYKADAPSVDDHDSSAPALTFGSEGFAAVAPDYLGLGKGPGTHPYMDVPSETTASLDMLRAARAYLTEHGRPPARTVFVSGFSQGALAALALARALQEGADPGFGLGAVATISGPYDMRGAGLPAMLNGTRIPPRLVAAYTTYLLVAWNRLHHLYNAPVEIFQKPYAAKVDHLFDGTTTGEEMYAALPDGLKPLLTKRGIMLLRHPTPRFAAALAVADNTCSGWTPTAPIRLYYARGDEQAVTENTDHCRAAFQASGADVPVASLPPHDYEGSRHIGSQVSGTAATATWFAHL